MFKILLADDSTTAQNMGKKILKDAGYEVVAVSNGAAAAKKIAEMKPDLIVMDIFMPGYSGLEICERVKNAPETAKLPVLLTVGKMEPYKPEDGARVKADGVIIKPFEASDLLATVKKIESKLKAAAAPTPSHEETVRSMPPVVHEFKDASYEEWKSEAHPHEDGGEGHGEGEQPTAAQSGSGDKTPDYERTQKLDSRQIAAMLSGKSGSAPASAVGDDTAEFSVSAPSKSFRSGEKIEGGQAPVFGGMEEPSASTAAPEAAAASPSEPPSPVFVDDTENAIQNDRGKPGNGEEAATIPGVSGGDVNPAALENTASGSPQLVETTPAPEPDIERAENKSEPTATAEAPAPDPMLETFGGPSETAAVEEASSHAGAVERDPALEAMQREAAAGESPMTAIPEKDPALVTDASEMASAFPTKFGQENPTDVTVGVASDMPGLYDDSRAAAEERSGPPAPAKDDASIAAQDDVTSAEPKADQRLIEEMQAAFANVPVETSPMEDAAAPQTQAPSASGQPSTSEAPAPTLMSDAGPELAAAVVAAVGQEVKQSGRRDSEAISQAVSRVMERMKAELLAEIAKELETKS